MGQVPPPLGEGGRRLCATTVSRAAVGRVPSLEVERGCRSRDRTYQSGGEGARDEEGARRQIGRAYSRSRRRAQSKCVDFAESAGRRY